jgi:hypothetical protein
MSDGRSNSQEADKGAYLPPPWLIRLECERIRAARQLPRYVPQYEAGIREYTYRELGIDSRLELER